MLLAIFIPEIGRYLQNNSNSFLKIISEHSPHGRFSET